MERAELVPALGMLSEASAVAGTATNAAYLTVLRGVSSAVRAVDAAAARRLTAAVEALAGRMGARSPVRAACLGLQHGLMESCRKGGCCWEVEGLLMAEAEGLLVNHFEVVKRA
jgi:hypothetical protein